MSFRIVIIFVSLLSFSLYSQTKEGSLSKVVVLGDFNPYKSEKNPAIENQIKESMKSNLESNKFQVTVASGSLQDNMNYAKQKDAAFLIEGFYTSGTETKNLSVFIQIYNPNTGYMIDAISI
ncbi:MAG TPA: hypothetical protein PKD50_24605, partial [Leptospiraceae bacterium]|nr:hypothetical protein [Leptospiraceae bacterium]